MRLDVALYACPRTPRRLAAAVGIFASGWGPRHCCEAPSANGIGVALGPAVPPAYELGDQRPGYLGWPLVAFCMQDGRTALLLVAGHCAANTSHVGVVQALLEAGANREAAGQVPIDGLVLGWLLVGCLLGGPFTHRRVRAHTCLCLVCATCGMRTN